MARLTHEQIKGEIEKCGYKLIDDSCYTSMNSPLIIECPKCHRIETSLADFRRPSFICPKCDTSIEFINPSTIPDKGNAYRIIAFDQATERFGLSIFDNGKLVFYSLYVFSGDLVNRLVKIKKFLEEIVLPLWKPDFVQMEDIQYQSNGLMTFKVLAMLLGVIQSVCCQNGVEFDAVSPNVWRKYAGTCGKDRRQEKMLSVAVVREKYNITVSDDVAESILIGRYACLTHKQGIPLAFGKQTIK